jgi:hypothetical protein
MSSCCDVLLQFGHVQGMSLLKRYFDVACVYFVTRVLLRFGHVPRMWLLRRRPDVAFVWILRRGASQTWRPNFFDDLFFLNSAYFQRRTPNVAAHLFDDLFFTNFCYFQLSHLILLQHSNRRPAAEHCDRVSVNASKILSVGPPGNFPRGGALPGNASIKFFGQISPGGPTLRPGGNALPGECLNETLVAANLDRPRVCRPRVDFITV